MPDVSNLPPPLFGAGHRTRFALATSIAMALAAAGIFAFALDRSAAPVAPQAKRAVVAMHDDPATHEFIQSTALSHVAPLRPEMPEPGAEPSRAPGEKAASEKPKPKPVVRPAAKSAEIAMTPPQRPSERVALAQPQPEASPEPKPQAQPRRILGMDVYLPSLPAAPDIFPSAKQVRERASEWADKIVSVVTFR